MNPARDAVRGKRLGERAAAAGDAGAVGVPVVDPSTVNPADRGTVAPDTRLRQGDVDALDTLTADERNALREAQRDADRRSREAGGAATSDSINRTQERDSLPLSGAVTAAIAGQAARNDVLADHYDATGLFIDEEGIYGEAGLVYGASYDGASGELTLQRNGENGAVPIDGATGVEAVIDHTIVDHGDGTTSQTERVTAEREGGDRYIQTTSVDRREGVALRAVVELDRSDQLDPERVRATIARTEYDAAGRIVDEGSSITTTLSRAGEPQRSVVETSQLLHTYELDASGAVVRSTTTGPETQVGDLDPATLEPSDHAIDRTVDMRITNQFSASGLVRSDVHTADRDGDGTLVTTDVGTDYDAGQRAVGVDSTQQLQRTSTGPDGVVTVLDQTMHTVLTNDGRPVYELGAAGADDPARPAAGAAPSGTITTTLVERDPSDGSDPDNHSIGTTTNTGTVGPDGVVWDSITYDYELRKGDEVVRTYTDRFQVLGIGPDGMPIPVNPNDTDAMGYTSVPPEYRHLIDLDGSMADGADPAAYEQHAWPPYAAAGMIGGVGPAEQWVHRQLTDGERALVGIRGELFAADGHVLAILDHEPDDERRAQLLAALTRRDELMAIAGPERFDETDQREDLAKFFDWYNEQGRAIAGMGLLVVGGIAMATGLGSAPGVAMMALGAGMTTIEAGGILAGQRGFSPVNAAMAALSVIPPARLLGMAARATGATRAAAAVSGAVRGTGIIPLELGLLQPIGSAVVRTGVDVATEGGLLAVQASLDGGQLSPLDFVLSGAGILAGARYSRQASVPHIDGRLPAAGGDPSVLRHPAMREYAKDPIPVTARLLDTDYTTVDNGLHGRAGDDYLVTEKGVERIVQKDIFEKTYAHQSDGTWIKTATIRAVKMDRPFEVLTEEDVWVRGEVGDYLVQGPAGEAWRITGAKFDSMYHPRWEPRIAGRPDVADGSTSGTSETAPTQRLTSQERWSRRNPGVLEHVFRGSVQDGQPGGVHWVPMGAGETSYTLPGIDVGTGAAGYAVVTPKKGHLPAADTTWKAEVAFHAADGTLVRSKESTMFPTNWSQSEVTDVLREGAIMVRRDAGTNVIVLQPGNGQVAGTRNVNGIDVTVYFNPGRLDEPWTIFPTRSKRSGSLPGGQ